MRSTASSLRSLATSASSSDTLLLPGGAVGSLPFLAALTQFAKVPLGMLIRFAAYSSVRPLASTNLTASTRNSGVYVVNFMLSLHLTILSNGSVRKIQVTSVSCTPIGRTLRKHIGLGCVVEASQLVSRGMAWSRAKGLDGGVGWSSAPWGAAPLSQIAHST